MKESGDFKVEAALGVLWDGPFKLQGNAEQIEAQLKLIEGAAVLIKHVCDSSQISTSLSAGERLRTLVFAFQRAEKHGHSSNGFYADRAVKGITEAEMELEGSPDQIKAKLMLLRAAAALVERAAQYEPSDQKPPQAMRYLRSCRDFADKLQQRRQAGLEHGPPAERIQKQEKPQPPQPIRKTRTLSWP